MAVQKGKGIDIMKRNNGNQALDKPDSQVRINPARVQRLEEVVAAVSSPNGSRPEIKVLYERCHDDLTTVTPHEVLDIFARRLQSGLPAGEILTDLGKALNLMYHGLKAYRWTRPPANSFGDVLMQENTAMLSRLEAIRGLFKDGALLGDWSRLQIQLGELEQFDAHYQKKENILFPYLERKADYFGGLAIMWALHDQIRGMLRQVRECLAAGPEAPDRESARANLATVVGHLFFAMHGIVFKEELILLPAAMDTLSAGEWAEMARQEGEYGFPFITPPERPATPSERDDAAPARFCTGTGTLDFTQLAAVFAALPVDLTVVDENNKVCYFTRPKDRIFPRSPAIIGRDVKNCHPPESVDKVLAIIEAFRAGRRDTATFWIRMRGRLVLIRYFCLRDDQGAYQGTLEVSQDITDIQSLEGEQRLAQWD